MQPKWPEESFEKFLAGVPTVEAEVARLSYYYRYEPTCGLGNATADEVERGHALVRQYRTIAKVQQ